MYENYWRLAAKPFENTADSRFYFACESHQSALLKLRYAIESRRSAAVLAGASGLGKTLLTHALAAQLPEEVQPISRIVFPLLPSDQLLALLADTVTGQRSNQTQPMNQSVQRIEAALRQNAEAGRHAIIVVDEAHLLRDTGALEVLRLLLNFELQQRPLFTLILVGQTALLPALARLPELDERMSVKSLLRPFTPQETFQYVQHRLSAAGATRTIFDDDAVAAIHETSEGAPRQINRICDLALLISYAEEQSLISAEQVHNVAGELQSVTPE